METRKVAIIIRLFSTLHSSNDLRAYKLTKVTNGTLCVYIDIIVQHSTIVVGRTRKGQFRRLLARPRADRMERTRRRSIVSAVWV